MKPYILPLSVPQADLDTVGGKGMSLAKLAKAGLPVPDGFHITTDAYRRFLGANMLQEGIEEALNDADPLKPATLDAASGSISRLFAGASIPEDLAQEIVAAYALLPGTNAPVAVRSSATAEDLPDASFAGQHDTYLNISGADQVLEAVKKCWASLWTARAIGYRMRQNVSPDRVALAVVVQLLVKADAAGILFTANPVSGKRDEMVINAAWGLGEAVVGGVVTPDTYTMDKLNDRVIGREIQEKQVMTVCAEAGTAEQTVSDTLKTAPVLSDESTADLARIGAQIETLYGMPMDIEWALAGGKFVVLQARPITALAEAPLEWKPPKANGIYMRASVIDLMPEPVSPLFTTLGIPAYVAMMEPLGIRLTHVKPSLEDDYFTTINSYGYMNAHFPARAWWWILTGLLPSYPWLLSHVVTFWRDEILPRYQKDVEAVKGTEFEGLTSSELWQKITALVDSSAYYTTALLYATMGASAGAEGLLTQVYKKIAYREGDPPAAVMLMGWDNIPIRAEKSLYDLAELCRQDESLHDCVMKTTAQELVDRLNSDTAPAEVDTAAWHEFSQRFRLHLEKFGYLVFELDFAKPLPLDHPEPMLETIKMYLKDGGINPYERQRTNEKKRIQTVEEVQKRLKGIRLWLFQKALRWAQSLAEVREDALAEIGLGYPYLRQMLHILGERLTRSGALREADEIYWLEASEIKQSLDALDHDRPLESQLEQIRQRKAFRKKARQFTPPPMLPFRKKYMGIDTSIWISRMEESQKGDVLSGVPTSPGRVTAPACVLAGPEDFDRMRSGDVLVAGATTPAWTPLFAMASAVVTDIGGPLSHGSIVAREYGIPAVMGTGVATRRIKNGQTITVDGSEGAVTLHPLNS